MCFQLTGCLFHLNFQLKSAHMLYFHTLPIFIQLQEWKQYYILIFCIRIENYAIFNMQESKLLCEKHMVKRLGYIEICSDITWLCMSYRKIHSSTYKQTKVFDCGIRDISKLQMRQSILSISFYPLDLTRNEECISECDSEINDF